MANEFSSSANTTTVAGVEGTNEDFKKSLNAKAENSKSEDRRAEEKKFGLLDFIFLDQNWPVWRQFAAFSGLMVTVPLAVFLVSFKMTRLCGMSQQKGDVLALVFSVVAANILIGLYAHKAYTEESQDFEKQQLMEEEKKALRQGKTKDPKQKDVSPKSAVRRRAK
eukprot:CAMPEP_0113848334 /NCGR_PEP_ID=MMETSP0372-20130328/2419_1 /TAXON_ID=340204 /ORGANISM="Lankesteria abbotti" /LENGTH=165 /DNA_ID=CAMNT_0000817805 /DNA_START=57 /DNA_END=554 /DNA_ORIENTATION=- /assembly_acc=CAM_ASM_000359